MKKKTKATKATDTKKKLALTKERVRTLSDKKLDNVAGGGVPCGYSGPHPTN